MLCKACRGSSKTFGMVPGGKLAEMGEKAKKHGIKNESVIEVCMLTHPTVLDGNLLKEANMLPTGKQ